MGVVVFVGVIVFVVDVYVVVADVVIVFNVKVNSFLSFLFLFFAF